MSMLVQQGPFEPTAPQQQAQALADGMRPGAPSAAVEAEIEPAPADPGPFSQSSVDCQLPTVPDDVMRNLVTSALAMEYASGQPQLAPSAAPASSSAPEKIYYLPADSAFVYSSGQRVPLSGFRLVRCRVESRSADEMTMVLDLAKPPAAP
ncbi:hypothetical protein BC834DRAFT_880017 [Gloeopeniophorella convolvens]|nr:hypothetical protein BC834DRAFT_880017 [Gloeopeniophorella convolvens]